MKKQPKKDKNIPEQQPPAAFNVVENSNQYGIIKISEHVIIEVIKKATCSVDGITKLSGGTFVDSIANMIGRQKKISDRTITININEKNTLTVEVKINVLYGEHIPELATRAQNAISNEIRQVTGLNVAKVDVIVQGIEQLQEIEKTD